jgi:predicted RNA-binding Zn-ribbon protein involved in translation (DUF1610 family)
MIKLKDALMYCIECGEQIPKNSKFCAHCGKQQIEKKASTKEKIVEKIIETEVVKQVVANHKKSFNYESLKKVMGWYFAWTALHLGILLIGSRGIFTNGRYTDDFWPFSYGFYKNYGVGEYDIREFLFYTTFPLIILIIWNMIRSQKKTGNK